MVGVVDVSCVRDGFDGHQTWIGTKVSGFGSNFRSQFEFEASSRLLGTIGGEQ